MRRTTGSLAAAVRDRMRGPARLARAPGLRRLAARVGGLDPGLVCFESWRGAYADSPRAIADELHRAGSALRQVWVLRDPTEAPAWATPVLPGSRAHLAAMGRARYVVANNIQPSYYRKREGSFYLQTWHGTPLKRIGFDITAPSFVMRQQEYLRRLEREVPGWDALISPNAFSTPILRRAFRYDGTVLETGYPRNDMLVGPGSEDVRRIVRAQLGIPDGARVVLYAPTYRDGVSFALALDLPKVHRALPDDVLLLRAHALDVEQVPRHLGAGVRDVSTHPEIARLYLAADVLVTDYSSAMFDFAVTGKPILFYTYDLALYRDRIRGFYFDFESLAPGPLLSTTDELIAALRGIDAVREEYAAAYAAFRERFCHLDDGRAARRVVEQVFDR